jgi:hypothetical protein
MRERREVARGADGALRRDQGQQAAREAGFEHCDHRPTDARRAAGEAAEFERQDQSHHLGRQRLADAGGVAQHDVALERGEIACCDSHLGQLPEAGVDAVHGLALGEDGGDRGRARFHRWPAGGVEAWDGAAIDGAPLGEGGVARRQDHSPPQTRACSGL